MNTKKYSKTSMKGALVGCIIDTIAYFMLAYYSMACGPAILTVFWIIAGATGIFVSCYYTCELLSESLTNTEAGLAWDIAYKRIQQTDDKDEQYALFCAWNKLYQPSVEELCNHYFCLPGTDAIYERWLKENADFDEPYECG